MSELKPGLKAYSFVGINDYVDVKIENKMSELTKCASCGTTLRIPNNNNCVLHSSQQGLAIEAFEKRVTDMSVEDNITKKLSYQKALEDVEKLRDEALRESEIGMLWSRFWKEFSKLEK